MHAKDKTTYIFMEKIMNKEIIEKYQDYDENLKKCKFYREKYQLIDNGKEIIEAYNVNLAPKFNTFKDPYINEKVKFMKLITDLDFVNQNIIESYEIWEKIKKSGEKNAEMVFYNTYLYNRINKLNEYIVFDLKHFIDEVLATISVIKNAIMNDKICISSIGDYLHEKNDKFHEFDNFKNLFEKLDDLSNSYKHSYANSDFPAIGLNEDCFVALYSKHNNFSNQPIPYVVSINYIVEEFNKFYKFSFELIDSLTKQL